MLERLQLAIRDRYFPDVEDELARKQLRKTAFEQPEQLSHTALEILTRSAERQSPNVLTAATCLQVMDSTTLSPEIRSYIGLSEQPNLGTNSFVTSKPLQLAYPGEHSWNMKHALCKKSERYYREAKSGKYGSSSYMLIPDFFEVKFYELTSGLPLQTFELIDSSSGIGSTFVKGVWYIPRSNLDRQQKTVVFYNLKKLSYTAFLNPDDPTGRQEIDDYLYEFTWQPDRLYRKRR